MKARILIFTMLMFQSVFAFNELEQKAIEKKVSLSEEDKKILDIGEIGTTQYVVGGILGTYPIGFGLGHAIQGRWSYDGKIFTFGELGSVALIAMGVSDCLGDVLSGNDCDSGSNALLFVGAFSYLGLRVWEIVDVWYRPLEYNKKYQLMSKHINEKQVFILPVISPEKNGLAFGLTF